MWFPVCITVLLLATARGSEEDLLRIDSIVQEDPCSRAGGICTVAADCPKDHLSERSGLCPQQLRNGVECCYGVSKKETRCVKHGGVCMPQDKFCNPKLVFNGAGDCPDTFKCCIMTV